MVSLYKMKCTVTYNFVTIIYTGEILDCECETSVCETPVCETPVCDCDTFECESPDCSKCENFDYETADNQCDSTNYTTPLIIGAIVGIIGLNYCWEHLDSSSHV